jgi:hypothetical protein
MWPTCNSLHVVFIKFGVLYNIVFELFASISFFFFLLSSINSLINDIINTTTNGNIDDIGDTVLICFIDVIIALNRKKMLKKLWNW